MILAPIRRVVWWPGHEACHELMALLGKVRDAKNLPHIELAQRMSAVHQTQL